MVKLLKRLQKTGECGGNFTDESSAADRSSLSQPSLSKIANFVFLNKQIVKLLKYLGPCDRLSYHQRLINSRDNFNTESNVIARLLKSKEGSNLR